MKLTSKKVTCKKCNHAVWGDMVGAKVKGCAETKCWLKRPVGQKYAAEVLEVDVSDLLDPEVGAIKVHPEVFSRYNAVAGVTDDEAAYWERYGG